MTTGENRDPQASSMHGGKQVCGCALLQAQAGGEADRPAVRAQPESSDDRAGAAALHWELHRGAARQGRRGVRQARRYAPKSVLWVHEFSRRVAPGKAPVAAHASLVWSSARLSAEVHADGSSSGKEHGCSPAGQTGTKITQHSQHNMYLCFQVCAWRRRASPMQSMSTPSPLSSWDRGSGTRMKWSMCSPQSDVHGTDAFCMSLCSSLLYQPAAGCLLGALSYIQRVRTIRIEPVMSASWGY